MPTLIQSIILSITQAITELLPISSSGHLLIVSTFLKIPIDQNLMTFLHFWTALAILGFYAKKIITILRGPKGTKFFFWIGVATIPAALVGFLFDEMIEATFYNLGVVLFDLVFWGVLMILLDRYYNKKQKSEKTEQTQSINVTNPKNILKMGFSQILAIIPGTSRSGISTMTGMLSGLNKSDALDIAFILGIPITIGPFFVEMLKQPELIKDFVSVEALITGVVTFVAGLLAISLITRLKKTNFLTIFGWYRIALGLGIALLILLFK